MLTLHNPSKSALLLVLLLGLFGMGSSGFWGWCGGYSEEYEQGRKTGIALFGQYRLTPQWTPDGNHILFPSITTSDGHYLDWTKGDTYIVTSDGKSLQALPSERYGLDISPNGSRIVYYTTRHDSKFDTDIETSALDGSDQQRLTESSQGAILPSWSPDGSRIAYAGNDGIYTMATDGTDVRRIFEFRSFDTKSSTSEDYHEAGPVWSHDGESLALVVLARTIVGDSHEDSYVLYALRADGSEPTRLFATTSYLSGITVDQLRPPEWAPDDSKLAFIRNIYPTYSEIIGEPPVPAGATLYTVRRDGSDLHVLTKISRHIDFSYGLSWSPDGSELLLSLMDGTAYAVSEASGAVTEVAQDALASYSPDGSRIAVLRVSPSFPSDYLYTVARNGLDLRVLVRRDETGQLKPAHPR